MNVLVLGGGLSGQAAALLLLDRGCRVTLADAGDASLLEEQLRDVRTDGGEIATGIKNLPEGLFDLCVVSPAFALDHPWVVECRRRGIRIVSELELGAHCWKGRLLAVTGSKGKSSIVKLCSDTLNSAGVSASPAGNYGIPLSKLALEAPELEWAVTEVSSFQMETTNCFSPDIAILLNVQPDHLDRHGTMRDYSLLKLKMFSGMKAGMLALLRADVEIDKPLLQGVEVCRFGSDETSLWQWREGYVFNRLNGKEIRVDLQNSWFNNPVFGVSAAAAVAALLKAGLAVGAIERGLREFIPLEHRMEQVYCSKKGVIFINDSKATSLTALSAALKMIKTPVRLIAGGQLKEKLSENTKELLTRGVKKVYLIGNCCDLMFQAWSDTVLCVKSGTLERAVKKAVDDSITGETVLLSPGTASFDQFKNYCERGERFKDLVREVAD